MHEHCYQHRAVNQGALLSSRRSTHPKVLVRMGAGGSWYERAPLVRSRSATGPAGGNERVQREQEREGGEVLALGGEGEGGHP